MARGQIEALKDEADTMLDVAVRRGSCFTPAEHRRYARIVDAVERFEDVEWSKEMRLAQRRERRNRMPLVTLGVLTAGMTVLIMSWGAIAIAQLVNYWGR